MSDLTVPSSDFADYTKLSRLFLEVKISFPFWLKKSYTSSACKNAIGRVFQINPFAETEEDTETGLGFVKSIYPAGFVGFPPPFSIETVPIEVYEQKARKYSLELSFKVVKTNLFDLEIRERILGMLFDIEIYGESAKKLSDVVKVA